MALQQLSGEKLITGIRNFILHDMTEFLITSAIPAALITVYSVICSLLLPKGVNAAFATWMWKIIPWYLIIPASVFLLCLLFKRDLSHIFKKKPESFNAADFIFLFIPMTPVVQYIISNQNSLSLLSSFFVFMIFAAISSVFAIIIPVLLSRFSSKKMTITAATAFVYMLMSMAALSAANGWSNRGLLAIQCLVFGAVLLALSLQKIIPQNLFSAAVIIFFAVNILTGILFKQPAGGMPQNVKNLPIMSVMAGREIKKHNDILFIVFEGYANSETLKYYGFDNSEQAAYLEKNGFRVYDGTYSIGVPTEHSLSKIFNIDRDITRHKKYLAGAGAVHSILGSAGYKTCGVFDTNWNLRGLPIDEIRYDMTFPAPSTAMDARVLVNAILTGEFSDTVSFEGVNFDSYLRQKHRVIMKQYASPVFMYSHSGLPGHGPSGMGMSLEERDARVKNYLEGMTRANDEMRRDVETLIRFNPDAIVIIAGDHGPFLTKTGYGLSKGRGNFSSGDIDRYDVQDRFGMFLAIRWPEKQHGDRYDIKILQDVFPAVFSYLYDDDTLFDKTRMKRMTKENFRTLGVYVKDGIIYGGKNNGQPLFIMKNN